MGRLQNPESQATYARYMAKFTIYFLRIIADEERTDKKPGPIGSSDGSGDSEEEEEEYEDEGEDGVGSGPGRSATRHPPDLMKDARELFCWQGPQRERALKL
ncbi:hypothetical protein PTMSG1_06877 [Pyrenophora teres f. maculata]|nr:hypothetical protein PTMSG1_06877 [Pyrenophora teres f. maculata]